MRAFVGFFTTKSLYENVDKFREESKGFIKGKWVEPQNLHITLQFLGDITREQSVGVLKNLQTIADKYSPFKVAYKSLGVFPDRKRPRILWMGVSKGENVLKKLAKEVSNLNRKAGIRADSKPFHPHVTVCRIKDVDRKKFSGFLNKYRNTHFGDEEVKSIALIASSLSSIGPIYTVVEEFYFRRDKS